MIVGHGQDVKPASPSSSTNLPHAAYVDRLLAEGREIVPYADQTPLNSNDIGMLVARYREIPSVTNKWGIALALAHRGDERVVDLFWNTLTKEYAGRCFQDGKQDTYEWSDVAHLVSLLGFQATRSEKALDLLKNGVQPLFWQTNVTWSIRGQPATDYLVGESIKGLAWSARDDAWQVVLDLKAKADPVYLKEYAGAIMDAAFYHYLLTKYGPGHDMGNQILAAFEMWKVNTSDGQAWEQWFHKILGVDEKMMRHRLKNSPAPVPPVTK